MPGGVGISRIRSDHGVVVGMGVVSSAQPMPSKVKSLTTRSSKLTTTLAGKVTSAGIVQVIRDVFVGLI